MEKGISWGKGDIMGYRRAFSLFGSFCAPSLLLPLAIACSTVEPVASRADESEVPTPSWLSESELLQVAGDDFPSKVLECWPSKVDTPATGGQGGCSAQAGPSLYPVTQMTRRLHRNPEFAKYAGLTEVTSCDEAARYLQAYAEYEGMHPGFDRKESVDTLREATPRQKMMGGDQPFTGFQFPRSPHPIVQIRSQPWYKNMDKDYFCMDTHGCTGVFIAKNWILTAAHCLQWAHKQSISAQAPVNSAVCPPGGMDDRPGSPPFLEGLAPWVVSWAPETRPPASGVWPEPAKERYHALFMAYQFVDPEFGKEFNPHGNLANAHDLALLFLPTSLGSDRYLPPDISQGGVARISAGEPPDSDAKQYLMAGWGCNGSAPAPDNPLVLRVAEAPAKKYRIWDSFVPDLAAKLTPAYTGPLTCNGDSGGPLYRFATSETDVTIVGSLVGVSGPDSFPFPLPCECPSRGSYSTIFWNRLDFPNPDGGGKSKALKWIESTLSKWPVDAPNFSCRYLGNTKEYECWRKTCTTARDCDSGYVCVGSANDYLNQKGPGPLLPNGMPCSPEVCGDGFGSCSCLVGQCVPNWTVKRDAGP